MQAAVASPTSVSFRRVLSGFHTVLKGLGLQTVHEVGPSRVQRGWWLLQACHIPIKRSEHFLGVWDPGVLQLQQPPHSRRQVPFSKPTIVSSPNVHCSVALLFLPNHCKQKGEYLRADVTHLGCLPLQKWKRPNLSLQKGDNKATIWCRAHYITGSCSSAPCSC